MIKLALLGKDISHSKSQAMYEKLLDKKVNYDLIDCASPKDIPSLDDLMSSYQGLSITSPYKKVFLNDLTLDERTEKLEAVNCIVKKDNTLYGHNTDFLAIEEIFKVKFKDVDFVIILGSGSMSKITEILLKELNIDYTILSRKSDGDLNKLDLSTLIFERKRPLIINSCSREFIFKNDSVKGLDFFDYNYDFTPHNHLVSSFKYYDGLEMLILQAKHALSLWEIS